MPARFASAMSGTLMILLFIPCSYTQNLTKLPIRLMVYNVENLFDINDDPLTEDDEFTPQGLRRWNFSRYNQKINSLYKTIIAAGISDPPELIALCEVENRKVIGDLVNGTGLSRFRYNIIHEDSPDLRGIDVCLIYRKDLFTLVEARYMIPSDAGSKEYRSRSVLYAKLTFITDTLHLFLNHWPSRRGGVLAGKGLRACLASMVGEKADSITGVNNTSCTRIIIAGDFNCTPDEQEIKSLTGRQYSSLNMVNLSEGLAQKGIGTYRYMGTWQMIDQIIVSSCLLSCRNGICSDQGMLKVFRPDFLLRKDPKYPGTSPFSTYRGYSYQGGISDHLPVLLDIGFR